MSVAAVLEQPNLAAARKVYCITSHELKAADMRDIGQIYSCEVRWFKTGEDLLAALSKKRESGKPLPSAVIVQPPFSDDYSGAGLLASIKGTYPGIVTVAYSWASKQPVLRKDDGSYQENQEAAKNNDAEMIRRFKNAATDLILPDGDDNAMRDLFAALNHKLGRDSKARIAHIFEDGKGLELRLGYQKLDDGDAEAVAAMIRHMPKLAAIDIEGNDFTDNGIKIIADALHASHELTTLKALGLNKSENAEAILTQALKDSKELVYPTPIMAHTGEINRKKAQELALKMIHAPQDIDEGEWKQIGERLCGIAAVLERENAFKAMSKHDIAALMTIVQKIAANKDVELEIPGTLAEAMNTPSTRSFQYLLPPYLQPKAVAER